MVQLLWQRETEGKVFDSPERRAALDKSLREAIRRIRDPSIRSHYGQEINRLRRELFQPERPRRGREGRFRPGTGFPAGPTPGARASYLAAASDERAEEVLREAVILAVLILNPEVLPRFEGALERQEWVLAEHAAILHALLRHAGEDAGDLRAAVEREAGAEALEKLFSLSHLQVVPSVRRPGDAEAAALCVAAELAKLEAMRGAEREIAHAVEDLEGVADEGTTWRLSQVAEAWNEAMRSQTEDRTQYDTGPNGARVSREERNAFKQLLQKIDYAKRGKRRP